MNLGQNLNLPKRLEIGSKNSSSSLILEKKKTNFKVRNLTNELLGLLEALNIPEKYGLNSRW
jgi:hypothetical protein